MENTVQNKKNSIDALARIVADMQQLYTVAQNIEQYCDEYAVFAGNDVINDRLGAYDQCAELGKPCSEICVMSLLNNSPAS